MRIEYAQCLADGELTDKFVRNESAEGEISTVKSTLELGYSESSQFC
jgi:hypothetical protein